MQMITFSTLVSRYLYFAKSFANILAKYCQNLFRIKSYSENKNGVKFF